MNLAPIGVAGCGAIGTALVRRMIASAKIAPGDLWVYDPDRQKLADLACELGVQQAAGPEQLFQHCRCIFAAIKPQDIAAAAAEWASCFQPKRHLLISLAAGIALKFYEERLPAGSRIIRLMPNTPCLIGEGAIAMSAGKAVGEEEALAAGELLSHMGLVVSLPERLMDAVTGLSGSGPAYVYLFIEVLIDAGVNMGLSRKIAEALAVQTVLGAARMVQESGAHPVELRNAVTTPAGTTAAALAVLEAGCFRSNLIQAVKAAAQRSEELYCE